MLRTAMVRSPSSSSRHTGLRAHACAIAAVHIGIAGCDEERWCPQSWMEREAPDGRSICEPSPELVEEVRGRLGTGFFGYVIGCRWIERGGAVCEPAGLARGGTFLLEGVLPDGGVDVLEVQVSSDGTYEVAATPHVVYRIDGSPFFTSGASTQELASLEPGEVSFFRLVRECGSASQEDALAC